MEVTVSGKGFVRGLGWTAIALFWITVLVFLFLLFSAPGDSGAGYVIFGLIVLTGKTFPVLVIPLGIMLYGVRKDHAEPLWKVLLKWGTIATMVYLGCLAVVLLFMI